MRRLVARYLERRCRRLRREGEDTRRLATVVAMQRDSAVAAGGEEPADATLDRYMALEDHEADCEVAAAYCESVAQTLREGLDGARHR